MEPRLGRFNPAPVLLHPACLLRLIDSAQPCTLAAFSRQPQLEEHDQTHDTKELEENNKATDATETQSPKSRNLSKTKCCEQAPEPEATEREARAAETGKDEEANSQSKRKLRHHYTNQARQQRLRP